MTATRYDEKDWSYFGTARKDIEPLLPASFNTVLDIGCGTGATSIWLRNTHSCVKTFGIEAFESASEIASRELDCVKCCDVEKEGIPLNFPNADLVLLLDVLEHLNDPWMFLGRLTSRMTTGGTVILSIPNVRYWRVSAALFFFGRWDYQAEGVLDCTHLRFFSFSSARHLVCGAGLAITQERCFFKGRSRLANVLTLGFFQEFLAERILISATKV